MNSKNKLAQTAEETLQILKSGHFVSPSGHLINIVEMQKFAEDNTIVYSPELPMN